MGDMRGRWLGEDLLPTLLQLDRETGFPKLAGTTQDRDRDAKVKAILEYLGGQTEPRLEEEIHRGVEGAKAIKVAALCRAVDRCLILRSGAGVKGDPYLYSAPPKDSGFSFSSLGSEPETGILAAQPYEDESGEFELAAQREAARG